MDLEEQIRNLERKLRVAEIMGSHLQRTRDPWATTNQRRNAVRQAQLRRELQDLHRQRLGKSGGNTGLSPSIDSEMQTRIHVQAELARVSSLPIARRRAAEQAIARRYDRELLADLKRRAQAVSNRKRDQEEPPF